MIMAGETRPITTVEAMRMRRGDQRSLARPATHDHASVGAKVAMATPLSANALPVRSATTSATVRVWNHSPVWATIWARKYRRNPREVKAANREALTAVTPGGGARR